MKYEDEHRLFLQGIMSRGMMGFDETFKLFKLICERCDVGIPESKKEVVENLALLVREINKTIEDLSLEILKVQISQN